MASMDFAAQCKKVFAEVGEKIDHVTEESMSAIAKETAQRIRTEARVKRGLHNTGKYASGWRVKKGRGKGRLPGFTVYNASAPGLTHLLEFGHVIRNAKGTYGRTNGIPHIKPAEMWATQEIMRKLNTKL